MQIPGYDVPERYHWPLLARSPMEFWRRWNMYIGAWARRYVFTPLALALRRRHHGWPGAVRQSVVVLSTFALIGLAHDFAGLATQHPVAAAGLLFFALHAAGLLIWVGTSRIVAHSSIEPKTDLPRNLFRFGSWVIFIHFLAFSVWLRA